MSRGKTIISDPTEAELDLCEYNMTMAQLKDPLGVFSRIPKSVVIQGKRCPKTALRKRDLCKLYLQYGGKITGKTHRELKNWTPPAKPSSEQAKYEKLMHQRSLDHHGKVEEDKVSIKSKTPSRKSKSSRKTSVEERRVELKTPIRQRTATMKRSNNDVLNSEKEGSRKKKSASILHRFNALILRDKEPKHRDEDNDAAVGLTKKSDERNSHVAAKHVIPYRDYSDGSSDDQNEDELFASNSDTEGLL